MSIGEVKLGDIPCQKHITVNASKLIIIGLLEKIKIVFVTLFTRLSKLRSFSKLSIFFFFRGEGVGRYNNNIYVDVYLIYT